MTVVAEILKAKPEGLVHSIAPTATVLQALQSMADLRVGALLVIPVLAFSVAFIRGLDPARFKPVRLQE